MAWHTRRRLYCPKGCRPECDPLLVASTPYLCRLCFTRARGQGDYQVGDVVMFRGWGAGTILDMAGSTAHVQVLGRDPKYKVAALLRDLYFPAMFSQKAVKALGLRLY